MHALIDLVTKAGRPGACAFSVLAGYFKGSSFLPIISIALDGFKTLILKMTRKVCYVWLGLWTLLFLHTEIQTVAQNEGIEITLQ